MSVKIHKILIANRAEIAVRIIRTATEMGIRTVAAYADQDINSWACDMADEAYALGGSDPQETYLNPEALIAAAQDSGADALHPGYGFFSESADFARAVSQAGLTWVGPRAATIETLGDKISARNLATKLGIPVIPGASIDSDLAALDAITQFPVLIKRADAGGGRGITRIDCADELAKFRLNLREAAELSGCFVEKMVTRARHVETQCARDAYGNFFVVSTRDCSIQRRNQKLVEEAPAPFLSREVEEALREYSRLLFEASDYQGVGTCEFLVTPTEGIYFLEVNPRLQVEHTVSEEVTGIDLVRAQILIAQGDALEQMPSPRGHSFEVRITSENPADDLMPSTGVLKRIAWPAGPGVRVDSFIRPGDAIGADFDSLIAKIIVTAPSRQAALARLNRALAEIQVEGVATCTALIERIARHRDFVAPQGAASFAIHTSWLETTGLLEQVKAEFSASTDTAAGTGLAAGSAGSAASGGLEPPMHSDAQMLPFTIEVDGRRRSLRVPSNLFSGFAALLGEGAATSLGGTGRRRQTLRGRGRNQGTSGQLGDDSREPNVLAPIQATVVRVAVELGQQVQEGDLVAVLESMKMEKPIYAPLGGKIDAIHIQVGDTVRPGQEMIGITQGDTDEN